MAQRRTKRKGRRRKQPLLKNDRLFVLGMGTLSSGVLLYMYWERIGPYVWLVPFIVLLYFAGPRMLRLFRRARKVVRREFARNSYSTQGKQRKQSSPHEEHIRSKVTENTSNDRQL